MPTIGYTTIGGSNFSINNLIVGDKITMPSAGTATSLSFYAQTNTGNINMGIYTDSSGVPGTLIAEVGVTAVPSVPGWITASVPGSVSLSSGVDYWILVIADSAIRCAYSTGNAGAFDFETNNTWGTGAMPSTPAVGSANAGLQESIYLTYTTGGGGGSSTTYLANRLANIT